MLLRSNDDSRNNEVTSIDLSDSRRFFFGFSSLLDNDGDDDDEDDETTDTSTDDSGQGIVTSGRTAGRSSGGGGVNSGGSEDGELSQVKSVAVDTAIRLVVGVGEDAVVRPGVGGSVEVLALGFGVIELERFVCSERQLNGLVFGKVGDVGALTLDRNSEVGNPSGADRLAGGSALLNVGAVVLVSVLLVGAGSVPASSTDGDALTFITEGTNKISRELDFSATILVVAAGTSCRETESVSVSTVVVVGIGGTRSAGAEDLHGAVSVGDVLDNTGLALSTEELSEVGGSGSDLLLGGGGGGGTEIGLERSEDVEASLTVVRNIDGVHQKCLAVVCSSSRRLGDGNNEVDGLLSDDLSSLSGGCCCGDTSSSCEGDGGGSAVGSGVEGARESFKNRQGTLTFGLSRSGFAVQGFKSRDRAGLQAGLSGLVVGLIGSDGKIASNLEKGLEILRRVGVGNGLGGSVSELSGDESGRRSNNVEGASSGSELGS